jgi:adenine-specific DNA-methyltransferase
MKETNKFEKQFLGALRDIFVGAKVEGDSGYVNLMRIKSRYYEQGVFPQLQKDITAALQPFPDFREELFDKLYTFFQRYFSESGSIYFRYTALHQNVYEKVYTDDRDVILFWKTHMLYYVKTDRIFTSLNVEVDGVKFFFDASKMTLKKSNEKREVVYAFRKVQPEDGTLVFDVAYSEKGKTTRVDDILKDIKKANGKLDDETLNKAFRVFEKQSEVDFFINKDARAFLQEQFDLWLYQYLFAGQNVWSTERLAQLQALKSITYKIIDFISQFEDELVKIWNKPKFVRNSHYVLTLDHVIASEAKQSPSLLERILAHPHLPQQVQEWRDLGMIDEDFRLEMLTQKDLAGVPLHPQYKYLPIDTKYFSDLELDILALFDDLDAALDGWLVHSENYQGLSTLLQKYQQQVKAIYIDPPYNTGGDGFAYKDGYQHASWLSMMENRLELSKSFLNRDGLIYISIDENEINNLNQLGLQLFGERINTIIIRNNPKGRTLDRYLATSHEYLLAFAKQKTNLLGLEKSENQLSEYSLQDKNGTYRLLELRNTHQQFNRETRPKLFYPLYVNIDNGEVSLAPFMNGIEVLPIWDNGLEGCWTWGKEKVKREGDILFSKKVSSKWKIYRKDYAEQNGQKSTFVPKTIWDESELRTDFGQKTLDDLFGERIFLSPKPTMLIEKSSELSSANSELIMDFFAGSGTTAHAVMNLNRADGGRRKYILVEMGEHFNNVILPRIKKVAFSDKWKDGKANGGQGMSHFVKYYDLEQYEDVLRRAHYADADLFHNPYEDPYHSYVFLRDLKMLDSVEIDEEQNKAHFHPERLYPDIDLAETLSQRRGKWIKRITAEYVEFQDGERMSLSDPDWQVIKPLVWWQ